MLRIETQVAGAEAGLARAETELDSTLFTAAATAGTKTRAGVGASTGTATQTAPGGAQLAADQAAIDAAQAQVAVAQQGLTQAQLLSPITGTVALVSLVVGQAVGVNSSTADVTVMDPSAFVYTAAIDVSQIASVHPGDAVNVVPDGTTTAVAGRVVAIGITPSISATSTSYPVTVGLLGDLPIVRAGSSATLTLDLAEASPALTIPTSAVSSLGNVHVVRVLHGSTITTVRVQLGTVGAILTAVTSGLTAGEVVVLADLNTPVPANNTSGFPRRAFGVGGGGGRARTARSPGG